jgi:hypothetical protein
VAGVRPAPGVGVLGVLGVRLHDNDRLRSRIERRVVLFDGDEMLDASQCSIAWKYWAAWVWSVA